VFGSFFVAFLCPIHYFYVNHYMGVKMSGIVKIENMSEAANISIQLSTIFSEIAEQYNHLHGLKPSSDLGADVLRHPLSALESQDQLIKLFNAGRQDEAGHKDTAIAKRYKSARRIANNILAERNFFDFMIE
jgi:hypothetical protein